MKETTLPLVGEGNKPTIPVVMLLALVTVVLLIFGMAEGLAQMVARWEELPEFSHGFILPAVALYLAWLRFTPTDIDSSSLIAWPGVLLVLLGLILGVAGEMSAIFEVIQYGFVLAFFGVVIVALGFRAFMRILPPLAILLFMVPFPSFIYRTLSAQLQLWSSALGVEFISLFDIPVFLEGNVIDLGPMKLQVVEACSGLRYLFPLMSLSYICAYLYRAPMWQRLLIFVSSMPVTLLMNSLRIGAIGVTVEYWGLEMAEGFLHDFEGWIMFMFSLGVLLIEIFLMSRLLKPRLPLLDRFQLDQSARWPETRVALFRLAPGSAMYAIVLLVASFVVLMKVVPGRAEIVPERTSFQDFPLRTGMWTGLKKGIKVDYLNQLNFTDYILADFTSENGDQLSFYVAYYDSQRKGRSVHSPRACLPGDGWEMKHMESVTFDDVMSNGKPLTTNKVLIQKGDSRSVVYYWFDQRGRNITNEFAVKWYLFQDSLMRSRTDGSLVRLVVPLREGEAESSAFSVAESFLREYESLLSDYVPR